MGKILISAIIILLVSSCASVNQFVVTPVGEEPEEYSGRFVYSLPQTVIEVSMEFEKSTYLPGPYRKFTEKYLGMSQFISSEKTLWEVTKVNVSASSEPDPKQYYSVNIINGEFQNDAYFKMISEGLVIDPMGVVFAKVILPVTLQTGLPPVVDYSMKRNQIEISDTLFKTVIRDSSFVKIPILRKQKEAKTLEQKAEEAANLIIKIRKRRLKLMTGEYSVFPEGRALEISIEELNKIEKEYLALFIGKIYTEKYSRSFFIVPTGSSEKVVLMKFSEGKGIIPDELPEGQPVTMDLSPIQGFPIGIPKDIVENSKNTLFYRVPATCIIRISESGKLLYDGRISVFQAGSILPLPVNEK